MHSEQARYVTQAIQATSARHTREQAERLVQAGGHGERRHSTFAAHKGLNSAAPRFKDNGERSR